MDWLNLFDIAKKLSWDDLTDEEKEQATESYLCIREHEEERKRNETTLDYDEPIDPEGVKACRFFRENGGYIAVIT